MVYIARACRDYTPADRAEIAERRRELLRKILSTVIRREVDRRTRTATL
jgi:hypothetical protein